MKTRVITSLILVAIIAPIIYFGGIAFTILGLLFAGIGTYEIVKLVNKDWPMAYTILAIAMGVGISACGMYSPVLLTIASIVALIVLFNFVVWDEHVKLSDIGVIYSFYHIIALTLAAITRMYGISNMLVFFMLFATCFTDMFALFCGMAFGKHKLNERISPKKTIEGAIGGFIMGAAISFGFSCLFLKQLPVAFRLIAAMTMCIIGQTGDLAFSAIKRFYGVKDFGNIFPGHGGVLDRIDSISFNSMWLYALMLILL